LGVFVNVNERLLRGEEKGEKEKGEKEKGRKEKGERRKEKAG
jgi:hypothetical protein